MRQWHLLLALSAGGALVGFVACGGSSSNPPGPGTDAGSTVDAGKDSANGVVDSGQDTGTDSSVPPCVVDGGGLSDLDAGDAALGDAGGSVGLCLACAKASCASEVAACNVDCTCVQDGTDLFTCLAGGGSPIACGSGLATNPDTAEQGLITCMLGSCADPCNLHFNFDAGTHDSGAHDASGDALDQ